MVDPIGSVANGARAHHHNYIVGSRVSDGLQWFRASNQERKGPPVYFLDRRASPEKSFYVQSGSAAITTRVSQVNRRRSSSGEVERD